MATNKMRPIHPGEIIQEEYLIPLQMRSKKNDGDALLGRA